MQRSLYLNWSTLLFTATPKRHHIDSWTAPFLWQIGNVRKNHKILHAQEWKLICETSFLLDTDCTPIFLSFFPLRHRQVIIKSGEYVIVASDQWCGVYFYPNYNYTSISMNMVINRFVTRNVNEKKKCVGNWRRRCVGIFIVRHLQN